MDTQPPPNGTEWERDGIGIINDNAMSLVIIRMRDETSMTFTPQYLRDVIAGYWELGREVERLKDVIKYTKPSDYLPEIIGKIEWKADECENQNWIGQAMAYRDVAGILRKGLK